MNTNKKEEEIVIKTGKYSWDGFALIKVTDYAEQLMAGKVYMQPVSYFRKCETEETQLHKDVSLRNDFNEGIVSVFKIEDLPVSEETKNRLRDSNKKIHKALYRKVIDIIKNDKTLDKNAKDEKINKLLTEEREDGVVIGPIISTDEKMDNLKLFCLYMLSCDSTNKVFTLPNETLMIKQKHLRA